MPWNESPAGDAQLQPGGGIGLVGVEGDTAEAGTDRRRKGMLNGRSDSVRVAVPPPPGAPSVIEEEEEEEDEEDVEGDEDWGETTRLGCKCKRANNNLAHHLNSNLTSFEAENTREGVSACLVLQSDTCYIDARHCGTYSANGHGFGDVCVRPWTPNHNCNVSVSVASTNTISDRILLARADDFVHTMVPLACFTWIFFSRSLFPFLQLATLRLRLLLRHRWLMMMNKAHCKRGRHHT